ncbi:hypothetical protein KJ830_01615 [bacterium]|nr:hypothetical protein [bacterium]
MNKKQLVVAWIIIICVYPLVANAKTFDGMVLHKTSKSQPFLGYQYKNINWIEHIPDETAESYKDEAGSGGQVDIGLVDLDGDGQDETIKVIWGPGVSDHALTIELYKNREMQELISRLQPHGIQPNFKVEDIEVDGRFEIIIWGGLWDFRMPGEGEATEETYEGHSDFHRYIVATYKFMRGEYYLWDIYTTKKKYEPFCEEQPI